MRYAEPQYRISQGVFITIGGLPRLARITAIRYGEGGIYYTVKFTPSFTYEQKSSSNYYGPRKVTKEKGTYREKDVAPATEDVIESALATIDNTYSDKFRVLNERHDREREALEKEKAEKGEELRKILHPFT